MARPDRPLAQHDLTHLRLQEMSAEQRAELRRRYASFVAHFGATAAAEPAPPSTRRVRKWVPGERAPLEGA